MENMLVMMAGQKPLPIKPRIPIQNLSMMNPPEYTNFSDYIPTNKESARVERSIIETTIKEVDQGDYIADQDWMKQVVEAQF